MRAARNGTPKPPALRAIMIAVALSSVSCAEGGEPVQVSFARVTAGFTPDPSNERIEGSFSVTFTTGDTGAEIESFGVVLNDALGAALPDVTLEMDRAFPILMEERTEARVNGRFGAGSQLPPPPDMTGWCADPTSIQLTGVLDTDLSDAPYNVPAPSITLERPAPSPDDAVDLGARWATSFTIAADMGVTDLAVDAAGNLLVGVNVVGADEFAFRPTVSKFDPSGNPLWTRELIDAGLVKTVSVAAGGDVEIITGEYEWSEDIDLGDGPAGREYQMNTYVARLDEGGVAVWSARFGDDDETTLEHAQVDASGNTLLVGRNEADASMFVMVANEVVHLNPSLSLPSGMPFGFVIKLGPDGDYLFGSEMAAPVTAAAVDASGATLLGGSFQGTIDLGGGPMTGAESGEMWITKLDPDGAHVWSRQYAASGEITALEVGPAGDIHLTARAAGGADFGGGPLEGDSAQGLVVVKLDPEGGHLWSKRFAEPTFVTEAALAVDDAGRVFLSGSTDGPARFGGEDLVNGDTNALFAAQLDPSGGATRAGFFGCSNGVPPALAFRSGVSEGVTLATAFRRFAALGSVLTATNGAAIAGFDP